MSMALAGEIDWSNLQVFTDALRRAQPTPVGDRLVIDASALTFIDHRGMAQLGRHATERAVTAVIYADEGSVRSIVARLLPMPGLDVVPAR